MPAYYPVRDDGTADGTDAGRYLVLPGSDFAALGPGGYYSSVKAASEAPTPPVTGDMILASHLHDHTYPGDGVSTIITSSAATEAGGPVVVMSVNDANIGQYLPGATERGDTGDSWITYLGRFWGQGMNLFAGGIISLDDFAQYWKDSVFNAALNQNSRYFRVGTGCHAILEDCHITLGQASAGQTVVCQLASDSRLQMRRGSMTPDSPTQTGMFVQTRYGMPQEFDGVYFHDFAGVLLANATGDRSSEIGEYNRFRNCRIPSTLAGLFSHDPSRVPWSKNLAIGCGNTPAEKEYQFCHATAGSKAETTTAAYRNAGEAFPSGTKASIRVDTSAEVSEFRPFIVELPVTFVKLSEGASDTLTLKINSPVALVGSDVNAVYVWPDGTTADSNIVSTIPADPQQGPRGTLTVDTDSWTGGGAFSYLIEIDTSGNPGADDPQGALLMHFNKASSTFFVDFTAEIS